MKLFVSILSLYILVLTAIPCVDLPHNDAAFKTELSQNTSPQHENDLDDCSPFCVCSCCASTMFFQPKIIQFNCSSISKIQLFKYLSSESSSDNTSIWQPPKAI